VAITAFSGDGITVNAGAADNVVLRNMYVTGLGAGANNGVFFEAGGSLHLESVITNGFSAGLYAPATDATLFIVDSQFRRSTDTGAFIDGPVTEIEHTRADANVNRGFVFVGGAVVTVRHSAATRNGLFGFLMATADVTIEDSVADGNGNYGVLVGASASANLAGDLLSNNGVAGLTTTNPGSLARIGGSTVTRNGTGLLQTLGTLESFGDNMVRGNTTNTSGTITAVAKT